MAILMGIKSRKRTRDVESKGIGTLEHDFQLGNLQFALSIVATIPHKNSETALIFHPFHRQSNVVGRLWGNFEGK